jgi:Flp pilus assembly protein TadD
MGRSFARPTLINRLENYAAAEYYHSPSDTWYQMAERDGKYFQRQYQIGSDKKPINVTETEIDFILGSGNHARTYLHRTPANQLIELPLGWYSEKGGYWAMNPGYDHPDHPALSRAIPYGCMFCHNAYPEVPANRDPRADPVFLNVPEGIDCQRCHGDGGKHIALARASDAQPEAIRQAIVNPARLPRDRQMDVCLQCHMEPKSASPSSLIVRYERQPFSFAPGESLADFRLHFDPKAPKEDRLEVVGSSAWRLMQSQCFLQSQGALTCITCHDPHRETQPPAREICAQCHGEKMAALIGAHSHTANPDCVSCHMPKRRTSDAVHVVVTDHLIQSMPPARDLLAPLSEAAETDNAALIVPSYPSKLGASDKLYLGIAQVNEKSNRTQGIATLSAAIAEFAPAAAEYYLQLGDALRASRRFAEAIAPYEEAVRREPGSAATHERLAFGLTRVRQFERADREFAEATRLAPGDAVLWKDLGISYLERGRMPEAASAFQKSLALDASLQEAHNGLGGAQLKIGNIVSAEAEFREAIRLRPNYAEAHHNLAYLLSTAGRFADARYHFEQSLRINPANAETRCDYAVMLNRAGLPAEAKQQIETVLKSDPRNARALDLLKR